MAETILVQAPQPVPKPKYQLPESERQKILAGSDFSIQSAKIEVERLRFIERFGSEFG